MVRVGYARAVELLAAVDRDAADLLEEAVPFTLTHLDFPRERRNWMRTDDVRDRANAEIRRRTRVVSVSPPVESLVRLVGAVRLDQNDAQLHAQNFIDGRSLREGYESPGPPAGGKGRRARPDARGGEPSWTSSVMSRKISAGDSPGEAYTTFRDTTAGIGENDVFSSQR